MDSMRLVVVPSPSLERAGRWIHPRAPPGGTDSVGMTRSQVDLASPKPQREGDPRPPLPVLPRQCPGTVPASPPSPSLPPFDSLSESASPHMVIWFLLTGSS
jgi:hypothetical protein